MDKFSAYSVCCKCGNNKAEALYVTKVWSDTYHWYEECEEHMLRTCSNCGYQWKEAPLDSNT